MATKNELIERATKLSENFIEEDLKKALRNAIFLKDNEERLVLQYALKLKTNTIDGYKFSKEQSQLMSKKLDVIVVGT